MSDKEADDLYYAGLAWTFGTSAPARQGTDADGHTFMVGSEPTDADMKREPSENTSASAPILQATPHLFTDIRNSTHPKHAESQLLRGRILLALRTRRYLKAFKRKGIPPVSMCPTSHATITTLLDKRDIVERDIDRLLERERLTPEGFSSDPSRQIEPEYERLSDMVDQLSLNLHLSCA